uniref:WD repeat-containing protein 25 n=1 Tax=Sphaerodactylus townsendi TaxID=933632 RepID=A0ACB8G5L7_9SAUR
MLPAIKEYKAAVQQTLDIMFLPEGKEFFTSTDVVSQDSADRTIMAWDFQTGAKISNQIFHERYTCPCLTHHPKDSIFVAQTNGNYMALFSSLRPYRINKRKRYEGHKVEGFAVGCEFSPDGTLLVTGSSEGKVFFYSYHTSRIVRMLSAHGPHLESFVLTTLNEHQHGVVAVMFEYNPKARVPFHTHPWCKLVDSGQSYFLVSVLIILS